MIQIDCTKPLLRINKYSVNKEGLQGIRPIIEDHKAQGPIILCASPCNTLILPVKKTGWGWRFVQDCRAINNTVILCRPVFSNPHMLLVSIHTGSNFYILVNLYSGLLVSLLKGVVSVSLPLPEKDNSTSGQSCLKALLRSSYFSQVWKADLNDIKFSGGFLGLAGHCHNWLPNFSLVVQPLYALLKNTNLTPLFGWSR